MSDPISRLNAALADRYRIERELGQGGMATVYLAEDVKHQRKVAVKVLRPELAASLGDERFLREIQIAARLHHPHILGLYDSGEADGFLFYVMPYVEGESLRDRLDRESQLPLEDALLIGREVADALSYAHSHDVIHRDIKPDNILLTAGHALVADFGIARAITESGGDRLTETGLSIGTPSYMSPEQSAGESAIDGRSDTYSLGCVVYEMLAGEPPHTGPNAQAIIAKRLTEPVTRLRVTRETVPPDIDDALLRALARVPADRYPTAAQFAEALVPNPTASGAIQVPVAAGPSARKSLNPAALGALALTAVAVVAVLLTRGNAPAVPPDGRPTLAVLPFENLGAPEDEYFADGITEEMTSRLAQISGLGITSRTSTLRYKRTDRPLQEVGQELGVQYILEGTVRTDRGPDGVGQVRVTPQLIRMSDDTHIWTGRYTASLAPGEIFAVQAEIAEQVATALNVTLVGLEREALRAVPTSDQEAHDAYLLGRFYWNKRGADNLGLAAGHFARAIERDSNFAEAHSGLADTYALYGYYEVTGVTTSEAYARAEVSARKAIALDSLQAPAHASLGNVLTHHWDWEGAEREFEIAIALDPGYAVARYWYAELLLMLGRLKEAEDQAQLALVSDPKSLLATHTLAAALYFQGRVDEAVTRAHETIEIEPDFGFAHSMLGYIFLVRSAFDESIDEHVLSGMPRGFVTPLVAGVRDTTRRQQTISVIAGGEVHLRAQTGSADVNPLGFAMWYTLMGATDSAFVRLEDAFRIRQESLIYALRDPLFEPLRSDPRYTDLLRRMGLEP